MLLYPEVQKKAQEELARVVGPNRLPEFDDRPNLPYLEAIMKEVLRWQMVTPVVVHVTSEADEYKGMYIPKNSVILIVCLGYIIFLSYVIPDYAILELLGYPA